ncbi:hypothetical protein KUCAC02_003535, partial [Chaenocephalus aceratus]
EPLSRGWSFIRDRGERQSYRPRLHLQLLPLRETHPFQGARHAWRRGCSRINPPDWWRSAEGGGRFHQSGGGSRLWSNIGAGGEDHLYYRTQSQAKRRQEIRRSQDLPLLLFSVFKAKHFSCKASGCSSSQRCFFFRKSTKDLKPGRQKRKAPTSSANMMSMNSKQPFSMHPILHEPKYNPLHSSSEAIRRACLPGQSLQGNIFAGFDETLLQRAEALAAVDIVAQKSHPFKTRRHLPHHDHHDQHGLHPQFLLRAPAPPLRAQLAPPPGAPPVRAGSGWRPAGPPHTGDLPGRHVRLGRLLLGLATKRTPPTCR